MGFYEYSEKTPKDRVDYDRPVEGLAALDDYTVQIKLVRPAPQFRFQLAHGGASIVSPRGRESFTAKPSTSIVSAPALTR